MSNPISFTGNGLNVAIVADYSFVDEWMSFACWYSIHRNLPDANVTLALAKPTMPQKYYYRWTAKAKVPQKRLPNLAKEIGCPQAFKLFTACALLASNHPQPLLIIDCDVISAHTLPILSDHFVRSTDDAVWFLNGVTLEEMTSIAKEWFSLYEKNKDAALTEVLRITVNEDLCTPCSSNQRASFIQVGEKCCNYEKKTWITKSKSSPFAYVRRLRNSEATINEHFVLSMWQQMNQTYSLMA